MSLPDEQELTRRALERWLKTRGRGGVNEFADLAGLTRQWVKVFRDGGDVSHATLKRIQEALRQLGEPDCGNPVERVLGDWTTIISALVDRLQDRTLPQSEREGIMETIGGQVDNALRQLRFYKEDNGEIGSAKDLGDGESDRRVDTLSPNAAE